MAGSTLRNGPRVNAAGFPEDGGRFVQGAARGAGIVPRHIAAPHHEGWRDWPEETPATPARSSLRKVPNPAGGCKAWKMWETSSDLCPSLPGRGFFRRGRQVAL